MFPWAKTFLGNVPDGSEELPTYTMDRRLTIDGAHMFTGEGIFLNIVGSHLHKNVQLGNGVCRGEKTKHVGEALALLSWEIPWLERCRDLIGVADCGAVLFFSFLTNFFLSSCRPSPKLGGLFFRTLSFSTAFCIFCDFS